MAMCHALRNSLFTSSQLKLIIPTENKRHSSKLRRGIMCCSPSNSTPSSSVSTTNTTTSNLGPPIIKKRKRYRKPYPGEKQGITEEMRFVAMRLRNLEGKNIRESDNSDDDDDDSQNSQDCNVSKEEENTGEEGEGDGESWVPSMEGFIKYLVDSRLVFDTIERIVDKSDDVSYVYFRKTGLERSEGLAKDLEWFSQHDIAIPEPSTPGVSYAKYLEDLAEKSAPLFLCHFYNIYFSHIASGQVIARQVCWLDYICVFRLLFVVISFMETKLIDLRIALPSLIFLCPDKTSLKLIYCAQLKIYGWSIICIRLSNCNNYYCSIYILQVK
uniref:Inactive heme oxygenase 2, chloroplastic n=1 Tax=Manihot esculenta TaxID=3983 RepID=A0A2C9U089_MANES